MFSEQEVLLFPAMRPEDNNPTKLNAEEVSSVELNGAMKQ